MLSDCEGLLRQQPDLLSIETSILGRTALNVYLAAAETTQLRMRIEPMTRNNTEKINMAMAAGVINKPTALPAPETL